VLRKASRSLADGQDRSATIVRSRGVQRADVLEFMADKSLGADVEVRRVYVRLIRVRGELRSPEAEAAELRALLGSAPGVVEVESQELHPKGGFRVTLRTYP
jgi:hypothetical protein